ncbi:MAG: DNA polymerase/3'-5' exonuclease PolX [Desulfohalobiaceae bacterium]|nr:DNA polymerase/3'-5' exonuclease PolX [Desulfohalobiaceae bacterium]
MPIHNADIQRMFLELADLLEIEGASPFRVRAYRNAARTVTGLPESVSRMIEEQKDLTRLQGIGQDLARKMEEIVQTGSLSALEEARKRVSPELTTLMRIPGLGPRKVKVLHEKLGVTTPADLKKAAESGKISALSGFGQKTQESILLELGRHETEEKRFRLDTVEEVVSSLEAFLRSTAGVDQVTVAGSYRRRKETVGDIDILVTAAEPEEVMDRFVNHEDVAEMVAHGRTKSSVIQRMGIQVDLRVVPDESYGAALHYFTGSKAHNIALRKLALERGYKINEYGVFENQTLLAGRTEEEVYALLDLPLIPPELREDRGEVQAAGKGRLPRLIKKDQLKGDLHAHTNWTDGKDSLEEMAAAAKDLGYAYLAITDHTQNLPMTHGQDPDRLLKQIEVIDRMNEKMQGFTLLKGAEVDILEDGRLDLPDWILKRLDLCVCSVHTRFNLSRQKQTERIIRAMDNPNFTILGHPSGRLIGSRSPYEVDMERVLRAARDRHCHLEINSQPDRLDLSDQDCKAAKELGLKMAISSDAHRAAGLRNIRYGIGQARRGWLEADDVLNTLPLEGLLKMLRR